MPERIYFGLNLDQLQKIWDDLRNGLSSGGINELQVSGIRTRTGNVGTNERLDRIMDVRLEGFYVVSAMDDSDPNKAALAPKWPDPRKERITRVESRKSHSHCWPFTITTQ